MRARRRDICSKCALAPGCADRSTPDKPRASCEHFGAYTGHRDLCSTCNHARRCPSRGTAGRPVFFCEEFSAFVPVRSPRPSGASHSRGAPLSQAKGLCSNCEDRNTCGATKPEGGVWHCEEYR
jgi:hypothetical protein